MNSFQFHAPLWSEVEFMKECVLTNKHSFILSLYIFMHIALSDNISLLGIDDGFLHTMSIFTNLLRWVIPIKYNAVQTKQYYMP